MRRKTLPKKNGRGFTLMELMVVIVILGILAAHVVMDYFSRIEEAKQEKARTDIVSLEGALEMYKLHNGDYPTTTQGLLALVERPQDARNWKGPYLKKGRLPKDPWKSLFVYLSPGTRGGCDLISYGKDGEVGGDGFDMDISNWDIQ